MRSYVFFFGTQFSDTRRFKIYLLINHEARMKKPATIDLKNKLTKLQFYLRFTQHLSNDGDIWQKLCLNFTCRTLTYFLISWLAINKWRGFLPVPENIPSIQNYDLRGIIHEFKNFNNISLLPRVTRFGQPMDTFWRLGAPTPISLNDGLSFNNKNNRGVYFPQFHSRKLGFYSLIKENKWFTGENKWIFSLNL